MTRSMTEKEKRFRDNRALADSRDEKVQNIFKRGWNDCFDQHLLETEKLKTELVELKAFKMKYENKVR